MTSVDVEDYLKNNGWTQYYHAEAWLHTRVIGNGKADYGWYTMTTEQAYNKQLEWDEGKNYGQC